jgi:hypothetical protein
MIFWSVSAISVDHIIVIYFWIFAGIRSLLSFKGGIEHNDISVSNLMYGTEAGHLSISEDEHTR